MHFTTTTAVALTALAGMASAGRISLYSFSQGCTGNSYNCNFGPGICCGDVTQRYSSGSLTQAPGQVLDLFAPTQNIDRCGNRLGTAGNGVCGNVGENGGITGARIRNSGAKRSAEEECQVPDSATLVDGTTFKINYDVPTLDNRMIKHLVDAGYESKSDFPESLHKYII